MELLIFMLRMLNFISFQLELERRKRVVDGDDGIDPVILSTLSRLSIVKRTDSPTYVEVFFISVFHRHLK